MTNPTPRAFEFTLVLAGTQVLDERIEDALFEAGCSDATLSFQHGRLRADFARDAETLEDAVRSAIRDVQKVDGLSVVSLDGADGVSLDAITRRAAV